jgi:AcrR family transcriptional regulator
VQKLDHDQERENIASIAASLIADVGADKLTTQMIADTLQATRGKVLHYFNNKQEIILAAFNWANKRALERMASLLEHPEGLHIGPHILEYILPLDKSSDIEWKVRISCWQYSFYEKEALFTQNEISQARIEVISQILAEMQESGKIRKDVAATSMAQQLYDMTNGLAISLLFLPMKERRQRMAGALDYFTLLTAPCAP